MSRALTAFAMVIALLPGGCSGRRVEPPHGPKLQLSRIEELLGEVIEGIDGFSLAKGANRKRAMDDINDKLFADLPQAVNQVIATAPKSGFESETARLKEFAARVQDMKGKPFDPQLTRLVATEMQAFVVDVLKKQSG